MYELLPIESSQMIDLHGKSVQETKKLLAEKFSVIEENQIREFYIITGRGNHVNADGNRGVLKRVLPKLLKPYCEQVLEVNPEVGAYKIILKKESPKNLFKQLFDGLFNEDHQSHFLKVMQEKAKQNDLAAISCLATLHLSGDIEGFSDPQKAIGLLEQAKELGSLDAYVLLSEIYRKKSDYVKSIKYLKYAADHNDPIAQLTLARCYLFGQGVIRSDADAIFWMTKAADQGEAYAQDNLGRSYYEGEFTEQNIDLAIKYLTLASNQGVAEARVYLARCYATGDGVKQDRKEAFRLYLLAARTNHRYAVYQVGAYILDGLGDNPPDSEKALSWFIKSAELGDSDGQVIAAAFYLFSENKNTETGLMWLKKSVEQKNKVAYHLMAHVHLRGISNYQDNGEAYQFIELSANAGHPAAQYDLAVMLLTGSNKYVKQNENLGTEWLQKAAKQNYPLATSALRVKPTHRHLIFELERELVPGKRVNKIHFLKMAEAGDIVAQVIILNVFFLTLLTSSEKDHFLVSLWQQDDDAIINLPDNDKFNILDAYIQTDNLTQIQSIKIMRLLQILENQNHPQAFLRLGLMHLNGNFVEKNRTTAEQYWLKGAKLEDADCLCSLGYFHEEQAAQANLSAQQASSLYEKAFNYYSHAAKKNSASAHCQLGNFYKDGKGVQKNLKEAIAHYHEAMRLDNEEMKSNILSYNPVYLHSAYNLATLFAVGDTDFPQDKEKCTYWMMEAAKQGHPDAMEFLSRIGISPLKINSQVNSSSFWSHKDRAGDNEKINPLYILQGLSNLLGLANEWKKSKDDNAWCYIEPAKMTLLSSLTLEPITIRKTKDNQYILLLENVSSKNLSEIFDRIKSGFKNKSSSGSLKR